MYSICKYFLFSILIFLSFTSTAGSLDSLRIEKIKGKKFIVHRVDPKETLYSISRRYGSSIDEIYAHNEFLENGLKMYDELLIPLPKKGRKSEPKTAQPARKFHIVSQGETLYSLSRQYNVSVDSIKLINQLSTTGIGIGDTLFFSKPAPPAPLETPLVQKDTASINLSTPDSLKRHQVEPGETLFAISKKYGVTVSQLAEWNNLESFNLEIGQWLVIGQADSTVAPTEVSVPKVKADSTKKVAVIDTTYVKTDNSQFKKKTKEVEGKTQIIEEGFAMRIDDTDFTTKLLALHKTAPMGSLVSVKNRMTGIEIQVRVVGTLPNSGLNRNVLLRLSGAAYKQLGALDTKIPVVSTYVED